MVLDKYKQVYIGKTKNILCRIRKHWQGSKKFDRLLMGTVDNSILSIDVFRALDTTRVYAYVTSQKLLNENKYIKQFEDKYVLNRINGGCVSTAFDITFINERKLI